MGETRDPTQLGRVQPVTTDCFRSGGQLEGLLCGGDLGKLSVVCRPRRSIRCLELGAPKRPVESEPRHPKEARVGHVRGISGRVQNGVNVAVSVADLDR
jgi:hypothetical protein